MVKKTLVTASDNCDLSAGVPGTTTAPAGIPFVGCPVGAAAIADSFAASFIAKRLASSTRQLSRLALLGDPMAAVRLLQTTFAPRANYLASIIPGDWEGGRPLAGAAIAAYAAAIRAAAAACHGRELPTRAWCSIKEGGIGVRLLACKEEHAFSFLSCQLRVLQTLRTYLPAAADALLAAGARHTFGPRCTAARAALPPDCCRSTPLPALFSLDNKQACALADGRRKAMEAWRRVRTETGMSHAERLIWKLSSSKGAVGGEFMVASFSTCHLARDAWCSAVLTYLGCPAPGLEALDSDADPLAGSALVRSCPERLIPHEAVKATLFELVKKAGLYGDVEVTGLFGSVPTEGEPAPGVHRTGAWRRMDLLAHKVATGEHWMLDVTTPCSLTAARLRAWLQGGPIDAHVVQAAGAKRRKYADGPAGYTMVPAVVGMHGETGSELIKFLAMLAENYSHLTGVRDTLALKRRKSDFMRDAKRAISHALASGKAMQFDAARAALRGVTHQQTAR